VTGAEAEVDHVTGIVIETDQTVVTGNTIDGGQEVMIDIKIVTREETGIRKNYL
jgi:putative cofactor-binding repeat protein